MAPPINADGYGRPERSYRDLLWQFGAHLKDYCSNCTLAGFAYIANSRLHPTERVFWLICVLVSSLGCYCLIVEYQRSFPTRAVSIVYESLPPFSNWKFPSVSVCEYLHKYQLIPKYVDYIGSLGVDRDGGYPYELEVGFAAILYPPTYNEGTLKQLCPTVSQCPNCATCPSGNFRQIKNWYGANCSDVMAECKLSGQPFDCCQYFQPLITPFGPCFMLNSLQNNEPGSEHWLNTDLDPSYQKAKLELGMKTSVHVSVLNEEDIAHTAIVPPGVPISLPGQGKYFQIQVVRMVNDPDVNEVDPKIRSCLFPNESPPASQYKAYSFTTCIADCARKMQIETCGCASIFVSPTEDPRYPDCDLDGFLCLESHGLIKPDSKLLKNNNKGHKDSCGCLPSCNDGDIQIIYEAFSTYNQSTTLRTVTISIPALPTDQFRRQAIRTRLDVVVSMGGMLGLFLGASILSAIEFIYYFTVRPFTNMLRARSARV
ncbi:sodium channel protein Nach [Drosophila rhopaloa]|uniref:Sodium channel protein Nach n=1 Tax=Drosophila rhopaloa TaxID=1041015 RepID=A0A6P4DU57_DRORH|nr:sodium channel protein Nach [Drosophila rhopaloa]